MIFPPKTSAIIGKKPDYSYGDDKYWFAEMIVYYDKLFFNLSDEQGTLWIDFHIKKFRTAPRDAQKAYQDYIDRIILD